MLPLPYPRIHRLNIKTQWPLLAQQVIVRQPHSGWPPARKGEKEKPSLLIAHRIRPQLLEQINDAHYSYRHCEERSDVAIHEAVWIATSRSPSNDEYQALCAFIC
jgi:hypothetical protein